MATPAVREILSGFGNGASVSRTTGAATAVNDLLICFHGCDSGTNNLAIMTTPTGTAGTWTEVIAVQTINSEQDAKMKIWIRRVTVAGGQVVTLGAQEFGVHMALYVLDGLTLSAAPVDGIASNFSTSLTTSHVAPSVSPVGNDNLLICASHKDFYAFGNGTYSPPAGMVEQTETSSSNSMMGTATQTLGASGATGTRTFTSSTSIQYAATSIAFLGAEAVSFSNAGGFLPFFD